MEQELENKIEKIAPTIEKYRNDKTMTSHMIAWEIIKQQEVESKNLVKADVINSVCEHPNTVGSFFGEKKYVVKCKECGKEL